MNIKPKHRKVRSSHLLLDSLVEKSMSYIRYIKSARNAVKYMDQISHCSKMVLHEDGSYTQDYLEEVEFARACGWTTPLEEPSHPYPSPDCYVGQANVPLWHKETVKDWFSSLWAPFHSDPYWMVDEQGWHYLQTDLERAA